MNLVLNARVLPKKANDYSSAIEGSLAEFPAK
jgi:hypothetical protein